VKRENKQTERERRKKVYSLSLRSQSSSLARERDLKQKEEEGKTIKTFFCFSRHLAKLREERSEASSTTLGALKNWSNLGTSTGGRIMRTKFPTKDQINIELK
jgi:hypothetical protein